MAGNPADSLPSGNQSTVPAARVSAVGARPAHGRRCRTRPTVEGVLRLLHRRQPAPIRVAITMPLIAANVLTIDHILAAALRTPCPQLLLDLHDVETCDHTGAMLVQAFITVVHDHGGQVELHGARPCVAAALHHAAQPT